MNGDTVCLITLMCGAFASFGQGTFNFANKYPGALDAPVTDWDGTNKLNGAGFQADFYWALGVVTDSTVLMPLNQPTVFWTNGYFGGGQRTLDGVPGGTTITAQVRVWDSPDGATWLECSTNWQSSMSGVGTSELFQVIVNIPLGTPVPLFNLKPFSLHPVNASLPLQTPRLAVTQSGTNFTFAWPAYYEAWNYALQQNPDLNSTNWVTFTNQPALVGLATEIQYQTTIPIADDRAMFYRLAK
jgi:hypothetical protein